jgi:moderate conductance mechanosensitive channel
MRDDSTAFASVIASDIRRLLLILVTALSLLGIAPAFAQTSAPSTEKIRALTDLLRDPAIQAWLQAQAADKPAGEASAAAPAATNTQQAIAAYMDAMREFVRDLTSAIPVLPGELHRAWANLSADFRERGLLGTLGLLVGFAALGSGFLVVFYVLTSGLRRRIVAMQLDTVHDRLHAVWVRSVYGVGMLLAYAAGSIGAFLLFDWPPLLKQVVIGYLMVVLLVRLTLVLGLILLAPGAERFRVVPMTAAAARFWFVWSAVLVGYYFFVKVTLDLLTILGIDRAAGYLAGVLCGSVLLVLALFVVWRSPTWDGSARNERGHRLGSWLLSLYLVVVWLLLFTGSVTPFYVGVALLLLAIALRVNHVAISHLLRPAEDKAGGDAMPAFAIASLERGLRATLLIGGALAIAWILDLNLGAMTAGDTMETRLLRGAINAALIVLLADFAWRVARSVIDRKLADAPSADQLDTAEAHRWARIRTLLPILRNVLFIVLSTMALLMALSALGIEIGPLIAGAGVVGVAVGFGAQTVVKDIISGIFYLLDDAFRVGEFIQSGHYKGTVESFSLRSVKLRHNRGPIFTVPFGMLGAVENMSRDWVVDKMTIGVTYDTDVDKVRKIVKQIGLQLASQPEFAPQIFEPLKMQGIEQFGDFAVQLRLKMKTRPNQQALIRRRALAMIKTAFDENGIKFAYPTVQVAGGGEPTSAVAQQALQLVKPEAPAAKG